MANSDRFSDTNDYGTAVNMNSDNVVVTVDLLAIVSHSWSALLDNHGEILGLVQYLQGLRRGLGRWSADETGHVWLPFIEFPQ